MVPVATWPAHVIGLDDRGAIVLRQKWSHGQIEARLANLPACLIGMEACVGAHRLSRKLQAVRAILLASATAATLVGRRSISRALSVDAAQQKDVVICCVALSSAEIYA